MSSWPLSEAYTGYKTKRRGLRLEHQRGFLEGGPQKWDFCHSDTKSACYNVSCFCNSYLGDLQIMFSLAKHVNIMMPLSA